MSKTPGWLEDGEIPDAFWDRVGSAGPGDEGATAWLSVATASEIVEYQLAFELAAEELADYSDGPCVDAFVFSEDDTEDLCLWIVAQGRQAWQSVRAGRESLAQAARRYLARRLDAESETWTAAGTSAYSIFHDRFGESLSDRMREVLEHFGAAHAGTVAHVQASVCGRGQEEASSESIQNAL
ncbi:hypothetical protein [Catenulispora pinisilvae]|uniref:hypothetical protein n=1 Tax=Catenulispora pinisilvae TaxID=2705253 RepID=UPI00189208F7|nr:hypothetical protein [Catenulispora pinisilvae]